MKVTVHSTGQTVNQCIITTAQVSLEDTCITIWFCNTKKSNTEHLYTVHEN